MCFSGYRPRNLCGAAAQSGSNHIIYSLENIIPIIDMEKSTMVVRENLEYFMSLDLETDNKKTKSR